MQKHIWSAFLCLWIGVGAEAQTPAYLHYGVREGLPSNLIYYGLQDQEGLLWFGTDKGLARFDGTRFRVYGMADGLPDPEVLNLKMDRRGRIWAFCFRNKMCYRQAGRFFSSNKDSLLRRISFETGLGDMTEDHKGGLWLVGFSQHGYRLRDTSLTKIQFGTSVKKMVRLPGMLLGLSGKMNISILIDPDRPTQSEQPVAPDILNDAQLVDAFADSIDGRLLLSTDKGLFLLQWQAGVFRLLDHRLTSEGRVFLDRSGRFWLCSLAEGAICFGSKQRDLSGPEFFLPGKKITMVFEDLQGTLWFCTAGEGVFALPRNAPVTYARAEGLPSRNITAVACDYAGRILAGDDEGSLHTLLPGGGIKTVRFGSSDGYNRIRQIVPQPDGNRWVVTDEGLYHETTDLRDPNGRTIRQTAPLTLGHAKEIFVEPGRIWVATSARLFALRNEKSDTVFVAPRRKTAIGGDAENNAWAGGIEEFLSEHDLFRTNWSDSFPLLKSRIVAIRNGGPGRLWVVTPEAGLLQVKIQNGAVLAVEPVARYLKTPIANIQSLFAEPGGRLWMATNRGVFGLDPDWRLLHFDSHDGLADDDVNATAVYGDTLWAATANGLTRLSLPSGHAPVEFSTLIPGLRYRWGDRLMAFDLLDEPPPGHALTLPADASLVQLELAGLDYRGQGNMRYRCAIQNQLLAPYWWTLDNLAGWVWNGFRGPIDTTLVDEPMLSFGVHLPPGRYQLRIEAINTAGQISTQPAELWLLMPPHWYETIWFWLVLWGLFIYGLWRIYRARAAYRELNTTVSGLQLQALQAQINPHFVGNSINAIQQFFYPPDPVRASEYIAIFTGLLRRTLLFSEKNFIPFQEEIAYDRDYLQLIELRFGERFQYDIIGADSIPPDTLFPAMLLQTLLENATIHGLAPEGVSRLRLDFVWRGARLFCTVTDNGVGYDTSLARKRGTAQAERKSKGLEMLLKKIETLNQLYNIDLQFNIRDLASQPGADDRHGTRAVIAFSPAKIPHPAPATPQAAAGQSQTILP